MLNLKRLKSFVCVIGLFCILNRFVCSLTLTRMYVGRFFLFTFDSLAFSLLLWNGPNLTEHKFNIITFGVLITSDWWTNRTAPKCMHVLFFQQMFVIFSNNFEIINFTFRID